MTNTIERMPLTRTRTLLATVVAVVTALAIRLAGSFLFLALADAQISTPSNPYAGLGIALLGAAATIVVSVVAAVVVVIIAVRRHGSSARFVLVFSAVLVVVTILGFPAGQTLIENGLLVAVPALWTVPAASVGLFRWRSVVVIAAIGGVVAAAVIVVQSVSDHQKQETLNSTFSGPTFAPSESPGSPLAGYRLRSVFIPNEFESRVQLSYIRPGPTVSDLKYYSLDFTEGQSAMMCGGEFPKCTEVGTALGVPVVIDTLDHDYYVSISGGVIELDGNRTTAEALMILNDLRPSSVDAIARLAVDPTPAN
jgi:hypothetical protein